MIIRSLVTILLFALFLSCRTYTIPIESFKVQMYEARYTRKSDSIVTDLDYLKYLDNEVKYLLIENRKGEKSLIKPTMDLQLRVTQINGKRDSFYFDTIFIVDDTLIGGKSRFMLNIRKRIPFDSINKIEIQNHSIHKVKEY